MAKFTYLDSSARVVTFSGFKISDCALVTADGGAFDYKNQCIICSKDASEKYARNQYKKQSKRRNLISLVVKPDTANTLLSKIRDNTDNPVGQGMIERIEGRDLIQLEARYHRLCYYLVTTYGSALAPPGKKRGRPMSTEAAQALPKLYRFIEEHYENSVFTISDIRNVFPDLPTSITIKQKLNERFGQNIKIIESTVSETTATPPQQTPTPTLGLPFPFPCFPGQFRYCLSKRGKPAIEVGAHRFCFNGRAASGKVWWRCSRNPRCRAAVHTFGLRVVQMNSSHTCGVRATPLKPMF